MVYSRATITSTIEHFTPAVNTGSCTSADAKNGWTAAIGSFAGATRAFTVY
ncbi:hypothetical protein [Amycolatopsis sp. cmx-4-61]|uniref:hypothetical protein n=1 Tax=Amycolatopsis sp. cmx-4-61 TaxID=2790937 RepID=UPI00397A3840